MRVFVNRIMWLGVCVVAFAQAASAQESINYASIGGRVTDAFGAVIVGVTVTARHAATNVTSSTATDDEGRFRFPFLRVGAYEVVVSQPGFADAKRTLSLTAGAAFDLPVTLAVAGVDATVTVTDTAAVLETARSQIAGTVSQDEARALPLNGRNFLDLALLIPGVAPANVGGGTQLFPETSAVPGISLSVGGQRNLSNSVIVDGLSANDDAAGLSGITFSVDAVDELQVVTSGGQAELGRAIGGHVNVVTRSGTNLNQGTMYVFGRDERFNARNPLLDRDIPKLPMGQAQFGGSVSGPVVRNRSFFFANVERNRLNQSGLVTILRENADAINARLQAVGYAGPAVSTGVYPSPVRATNLLGKFDHQLRGNDHLSVRYSLYQVTAENARGVGALNAPSASSGLDNRDQTVAVNNIVALGSRTVLETRAQIALSDLEALATDAVGPNVSISGTGTFGTLSSSPTGRDNTMSQIVNSVSHQAGAHALRAGLDVLYNDLTITFPRSVRGSYSFSSLANFLSGTYGNGGFTQTFGNPVVAQTNPNVGVYAQDEWKVGSALTLNVGFRYDLQFMNTISTDTNNLSPRAGFAWVPFEARRTVIRGSAGVFYDRVPLRALANALLSAGNTTDIVQLRQTNVSLSPTQSGAPLFPAILTGVVPTVTLVNLTTMDPRIQNARSTQASVELEHQLGPRTTVSVGVEHLRGRELIMSVNQNVPTCVAAGTNNGCRPNSTYANNSQYSSVASSEFNMLSFSLVQRLSRWGSYRVSYALSKSMNDVGEAFFNGPIDPFDLSKDWARANGDQRHRLVVNGAVSTSLEPATTVWEALTRGFQLSGVLQYYSATPLNVTSGVTTLQGTAGRPIVDGAFIARNSEPGADFVSLGLRLSRSVRLGRTRLEGLVEGFNLLNRKNVLALNGNFGSGAYPTTPSSTFRQITAVADPRGAQFGVRISF